MNLEQPIGPGWFIFFQEPTYATDEGRPREKRKPRPNYELEAFIAKYDLVEEHVSEPIFKQTIEVVESMAKGQAEKASRKEMAEILGLDRKLEEPQLVKAYIEYQIIELYKRMRRDEDLLLIILASVIN